jgi:hypothetical protein
MIQVLSRISLTMESIHMDIGIPTIIVLQSQTNWSEINRAMTQPRPSLSFLRFSDGAFEDFERKNMDALNEAEVMTNAFPLIRSNADIPSAINRPFGNLKQLTDGTIVDAQPDFYYGASSQQLAPQIREELNSYLIPSANSNAPILPNNFIEGMGPGGTAVVVKRQACYDGALGARAMHTLQSYGQPEPVYDNNAYTIASTYSDGTLKMYTTHLTQPSNSGNLPEYHMNKLNGWEVTGNPDTFRQGVSAFRNVRDWAKKKRDEFIETANKRISISSADTSFESSGSSEPSISTNRVPAADSDSSADKLALNDRLNGQRSGKRHGGEESERSRREYRPSRRDRPRG